MKQPTYRRLSFEEREEISRGLAAKQSVRSIAKSLGRSPSTIWREYASRDMYPSEYRASRGQWQAVHRRRLQGRKQILATNLHLRMYVFSKLRLKWSPSQIAKRIRIEYPLDIDMSISPETIYRYLYVIPKGTLKKKLLKSLRQHHKRRHHHRVDGEKRLEMRGRITEMVSINERPPEVEGRLVPGHWEGDLIMGAWRHSAIGTLTERTTRLTIIVPLTGTDPETVRKAFAKEFCKIPINLKKTLTYDRGSEMKHHVLFSRATKIQVYFAHASSPWERGTNENTNGLIRQFFPKPTDFTIVTRRELKRVQRLLNDRPRRCLGFKKPNEVFGELLR